jgi:hypothetical protein
MKATARLLLLRFANVGASIFVAALAGCGDDPPTKPAAPASFLPASTPQNVLGNLALAYTRRDSLAYDSLFDAAYVGTSVDQSDPSPVVYTFNKADESLHIRALARRSTIVSVNIQFPPNLSRFYDFADTLGWATVQTSGTTLQIDDGAFYYAVGSNETMEFKFKPMTPSPGSPTDTTWHIVRWTEIAQ